jgi:hypothetical protein
MGGPTAAAVMSGATATAGAGASTGIGLSGWLGIGALSLGGISTFSQMSQANRNYEMQLRNQQRQFDYEMLQFNQTMAYQQEQYEREMLWKQTQMDFQKDQFDADMAFKQEQFAWQQEQYAMQLAYEHEQRMAQYDYANEAMKAAMKAMGVDLDLLDLQSEQVKSKYDLDDWERKRQGLREQAQIRVAQGESGLFGNSAIKEIANSMLNTSYDRGIIKYNKKNTLSQIEAKKEKVRSQAKARMNEAMSGLPSRSVQMNTSQLNG